MQRRAGTAVIPLQHELPVEPDDLSIGSVKRLAFRSSEGFVLQGQITR